MRFLSLLIEAPEEVREENSPNTPEQRRLGKNHAQLTREEDKEDDIRDEEHLDKVGLLSPAPFTPPVKADLGRLQLRKEPDQQQGEAKQDRYSSFAINPL